MEKYRKKLDKIDQEMRKLFIERMEIIKEIASYKSTHNLPVEDQKRESQMIQDLLIEDPLLKDLYIKFLYEVISASKIYQETLITKEDNQWNIST